MRTKAQKWASTRRRFLGQLCGMRTTLRQMTGVDLTWAENSKELIDLRVEVDLALDRMIKLIRKRNIFSRLRP